jgi:hypothetical protein
MKAEMGTKYNQLNQIEASSFQIAEDPRVAPSECERLRKNLTHRINIIEASSKSGVLHKACLAGLSTRLRRGDGLEI